MKARPGRYHCAPFLLLFLATSACASTAAANRAVPHRWPAGTEIAYVLTNGQTQTISIPGQGEQVLTAETTFELLLTGREASTFTLTVQRADSRDDAAAMGGDAPDITDVIGLESVITLDSRGHIASATGLDENRYVIDQGGVPSFHDLLQILFLPLPEGRLEEGTAWTREYSYPIDQLDGTHLELSFIDRYVCRELTEYEGTPAWLIEVTSEAAVTGTGDDIGVGMSGSGTAVIHAAEGSAMILSAEMETALEGTVSIPGMDLPLTMHFRRAARIRE